MKSDRPSSSLSSQFENLHLDIGVDLYLRRFETADADAVYQTVKRNEAHLIEFMHWMTPDYSREMAAEFIGRATKPMDAD